MNAVRSGHAIYFILITILIDTLGFGMIAPVMPKLISELTGEGFAEAPRSWLPPCSSCSQWRSSGGPLGSSRLPFRRPESRSSRWPIPDGPLDRA